MIGETLVFFVYVGAAIGLIVLVGCVMTLASIAVGDPDPLAWAKEIGRMASDGHSHAQREYERARDEYQRSLRESKP